MHQRKIIHVDMDCFYAAVEVKHRPELKGLPLGIGGPAASRSVLCTASYEARKFKVRSAMATSQAVRLCPDLVVLPPNFPLYKKESAAIRKIFLEYTDKVEPLSLDEAYLDVSDCGSFSGSATLIAKEIRQRIKKELCLTASAGVAPNKFLAKIASDWKKPDGQFVIRPEEIEKFMLLLPVEKIFGVGKVTAKKMHNLGLKTCGDIQKRSIYELARWFGSRAQELSDLSRGIDYRPVESKWERKSLTVESTYDSDLLTFEDWRKNLLPLYKDWEERMLKSNMTGKIRGHVVKVKFTDFKSSTHESSSKRWPQLKDFEGLLKNLWDRRSDPIRLLGLGVRLGSESKIADDSQLSFSIEKVGP